MKAANAGKKVNTSKYIMQGINTILVKYHVVLYVT